MSCQHLLESFTRYREELRNMIWRIAKAGYFCFLLKTYYKMDTLLFNLLQRNEAMTKVISAASII
tara:strand:- start:175 stop:369 length:195 start_codon:yes stop_codon:yes gene_type:complete